MSHGPALRIALTGAPGAGKTTLLGELARRGYATEPEVARALLRKPGGMGLREHRPVVFAQSMLAAELGAWRRGSTRSLTFFDRGFPDIAAFLELEGESLPPDLDGACRTLRYGIVFRAPPWKAIYQKDEERVQSWEQALASDEAVCAFWRRYGYEPIDLPLAPVDARAEFAVKQCLSRT